MLGWQRAELCQRLAVLRGCRELATLSAYGAITHRPAEPLRTQAYIATGRSREALRGKLNEIFGYL